MIIVVSVWRKRPANLKEEKLSKFERLSWTLYWLYDSTNVLPIQRDEFNCKECCQFQSFGTILQPWWTRLTALEHFNYCCRQCHVLHLSAPPPLRCSSFWFESLPRAWEANTGGCRRIRRDCTLATSPTFKPESLTPTGMTVWHPPLPSLDLQGLWISWTAHPPTVWMPLGLTLLKPPRGCTTRVAWRRLSVTRLTFDLLPGFVV